MYFFRVDREIPRSCCVLPPSVFHRFTKVFQRFSRGATWATSSSPPFTLQYSLFYLYLCDSNHDSRQTYSHASREPRRSTPPLLFARTSDETQIAWVASACSVHNCFLQQGDSLVYRADQRDADRKVAHCVQFCSFCDYRSVLIVLSGPVHVLLDLQ